MLQLFQKDLFGCSDMIFR